MSNVGQREIRTQQRVVAFFQDALQYAYLGHWRPRPDNRNVEEGSLTDWLVRRGHTDQFRALMDRYLPQWRLRRDTLNTAPLRHEDWQY